MTSIYFKIDVKQNIIIHNIKLLLIIVMYESAFSKKNSTDQDHFYFSKEGYIIFTEKYHLKRGYCCKNECKHCPF